MPNRRFATLLVFALTTIFYAFTLLPSLAWGDGVKLQTEAVTGESFVLSEMDEKAFAPDPYVFSKVGVAAWDHPLYIILGHVLVRVLPFVDSLWLVNFISAFFGAASIALVYLLCYQFTESTPASTYAAFSLAVSHTFWWHSSTPEVYTLFVFLLLASFHFFDQFERARTYSSVFLSGLFLGLAASDHVLAALAVPALVLYYFFSKGFRVPQRVELRSLIYAVLGFMAGFLIYLIQFARIMRSIPPAELMGPVVGITFLGALGVLNPALLGRSLLTFLVLLTVQFSPLGLMLGAYGVRQAFQSEDVYLRRGVAFLIVFSIFGILYQVTDQFAFFLTAYVFWALMMGIGARYFLSRLPDNLRLVWHAALALVILGTPFLYAALPRVIKQAGLDDASAGIPQIGTGLRDGLTYYINPNKRGDLNAYDFGTQTLTDLAPNAVVIAEWYIDTDEYFVLRYLVNVERLRPDVTIVGWPTEDPFTFDPRLVTDVIEESLPQRPVYLASLSEQFYESSKLMQQYCIVPESNLYRVYSSEFRGTAQFQCLEADSNDQ